MRICVVYDCLFPWTVGGAEKWYRQLAEAYAASGHEVTYLTARQWDVSEPPVIKDVQVVSVSSRKALYANGKRRIAPPLLFGIGVFLHLLRRGRRYDVVHTASFPYFSVLAIGALRRLFGWRVAIDWHEVWTQDYWREYLGLAGGLGRAIQWLCGRIPHTAFSFSRLHQARARALTGGEVTLLEGEYAGAERGDPVDFCEPLVVYAGRMIPEKRVLLLAEALVLLMQTRTDLSALLIGAGPDHAALSGLVAKTGLAQRIGTPGFVHPDALETAMRSAAVIVQPSRREGYGMVVVEAAARGVPVIVVASEDNAAVELIEPGVNGFMVDPATPAALAEAIGRAVDQRDALRRSTRRWFEDNARRLSFANSFATIQARLGIA